MSDKMSKPEDGLKIQFLPEHLISKPLCLEGLQTKPTVMSKVRRALGILNVSDECQDRISLAISEFKKQPKTPGF